ncbi:MAG: hypothetical protein AB1609_22090 [Bacillota bacterium]
MKVWQVSYPTQVLELEVHGELRPVKVIGSKDEFRLYEDALAHAEHLRRIWPGLRVVGPEPVEDNGLRPVGRGARR